MKRFSVILISGLLLSTGIFAQDVKDKYHGTDDMYGGKKRYKEKRVPYDNYNPDKYKEDASKKDRKAVIAHQQAEAERFASYYGYDEASIARNKKPTWEAWEVYTQRQVDTSLINKYFKARNTVVMVNLYPVDSSSIKWIDKKADRKKAKQARKLARASAPRYYSNYGGYGGYGYGGYGYGGYGYPYGYGSGFGLRPSIGIGWNSNTGWGVGMGMGLGFGYARPYGGWGGGWNSCSGSNIVVGGGGGYGGAGAPMRYR